MVKSNTLTRESSLLGIRVRGDTVSTIKSLSKLLAAYAEPFYWRYKDITIRSEEISIRAVDSLIERYLISESYHRLSGGIGMPGFLPHVTQHLMPDWDIMVGAASQSAVEVVNLDRIADVDANASVALYCVDAAFWELYCRDEEVLSQAAQKFSVPIELRLSDKKLHR